MLNCCQPLLVVAVPREQTHSGLEQIQQIQQQLTQFNASLGETPRPGDCQQCFRAGEWVHLSWALDSR